MKTIHLDATQSDAIDYAAALLRDGQMVVFPTDTVYGIGVDAWQRAAVERLYSAKQRARDKGIPILIADAVALDDLTDMSAAQRAWIDIYVATYWPGPLTLVLPRSADLPDNLTPNDGIAVRIPDNSVARRLIRAAGGAVAASSANRSGEPPINRPKMRSPYLTALLPPFWTAVMSAVAHPALFSIVPSCRHIYFAMAQFPCKRYALSLNNSHEQFVNSAGTDRCRLARRNGRLSRYSSR